jgi:hypothetical protein
VENQTSEARGWKVDTEDGQKVKRDELKNKMIKVRVTLWEEAKLKALAALDGLSLSEYMRRCGLRRKIRRNK